MAAGATEILIKDAHSTASNIDLKRLPKCARIIRNKAGHPYGQAEGVDKSFDAAMFVGCHSGASIGGNPMSHLNTLGQAWATMNGRHLSEFMLYSLAAAYAGVPTVYLAGDRQVCEDYKDIHPKLVTTAVKDGRGASTISLAPAKALELIRADAERALRQDLTGALAQIPEKTCIDICYINHADAYRFSFYPGMKQINDTTIRFETDDFFEALRIFRFVRE